jgi:hypothetical protein
MGPSVVIIARAEHATGWRKRITPDAGVALFSDCEALRAAETIVAHPPRIIAVDRSFGATARGAALVSRVKSDPQLKQTDLRVLAEDEVGLPTLLGAPIVPHFDAAVLKASYPLDYCGTRRCPRFKMDGRAEILVNGAAGRLVNMSATGAQMVLGARVRPDEAIRLALVDDKGEVRARGVVAWSSFEPSSSGLQYRAGLQFVNTALPPIEAFCARHTAAA